jgi:hypothetical protein
MRKRDAVRLKAGEVVCYDAFGDKNRYGKDLGLVVRVTEAGGVLLSPLMETYSLTPEEREVCEPVGKILYRVGEDRWVPYHWLWCRRGEPW